MLSVKYLGRDWKFTHDMGDIEFVDSIDNLDVYEAVELIELAELALDRECSIYEIDLDTLDYGVVFG